MTGRSQISILMPCKDQKEAFLVASINSVLGQTSPDWILYIIVDKETPEKLRETIRLYETDPRVRVIEREGKFLAGALNTGMKYARTKFVCILLSDDLLHKNAIAILKSYIKRYPEIDFFHSSRRYIDKHGKNISQVMESKAEFSLSHFKTAGSPVKHLLCWRRDKGLEVGGMDEEVTFHGCDDYDFPWTMAEAGCKFKAIKECLYYYRVHHDFHRLTTHVTVQDQIEILRKIFKKHRVSEIETEAYIRWAHNNYILKDKLIGYGKRDGMKILSISRFREITEKRLREFLQKGWKKSLFFPHRIYYLPKGGPDGLKLASRELNVHKPDKLWEVLLYATGPRIDEFPEELFFDNDLIWHQQNFGIAGHVGAANLVLEGKKLYAYLYISDLVQRISRRREHKTRIENKFKGWNLMLLNGVLNFALEKNIKKVFSITSQLALKNTDPSRSVGKELLERVYDRAVCRHYQAEKIDNWWVIDVNRNKGRILIPDQGHEVIEHGKTVCICHDIERELGHSNAEPALKKRMLESSGKALEKMLYIEKETNVKATYNVLGCLFGELREKIERDGHCIAFHSYDHKIDPSLPRPRILHRLLRFLLKRGAPKATHDFYVKQLNACREVDYRIKGYRPPQSKITPDLGDKYLSYYNFEWLASSSHSLGIRYPKMEKGIVKIPIMFDDSSLFKEEIEYGSWENQAIDTIKQNDIIAFCLHDCYADYWLPGYRDLLTKIKRLGNLKTLDEVANKIILSSGD